MELMSADADSRLALAEIRWRNRPVKDSGSKLEEADNDSQGQPKEELSRVVELSPIAAINSDPATWHRRSRRRSEFHEMARIPKAAET
jgi:hypothetical protein